jgi:mannosyltransferase OCH1-like enzyme
MAAASLRLMQYWHEATAPADVERLMSSWRADPQFIYHRYSWESARDFVFANFDRPTLRTFDSCAIPALQSDLFRLCWLWERGGIYVDADQGNRGRNEKFTDMSARGHLFFRNPIEGRIVNGLMTFFSPHDELVGEYLERVLANIATRRYPRSVWRTSGPGVISQLYAECGPDHRLFKGIRIHGVMALKYAMEFGSYCEYKSADTHWQNVGTSGVSIYRQPSEAPARDLSAGRGSDLEVE